MRFNFNAVRNSIAQFVGGVDDGYRALRRYNQFAAKSDAELARLGISRSELARVSVLDPQHR